MVIYLFIYFFFWKRSSLTNSHSTHGIRYILHRNKGLHDGEPGDGVAT